MKNRLVFIIIGVLSAVAGLLAYRKEPALVQQVDLRLKDVRFRIRGPTDPTSPVAVVAIDGRSVKELGRWPWPREVVGRLVSRLDAGGASVIALDIVFSEPQGRRQDRALASAIRRSGKTIEGYYFTDEMHKTNLDGLEQLAASRVKLLKIQPGVKSVKITEYLGVDTNISDIGAAAKGFGFFNQIPDDDGLYRKAPLLLLHDGVLYPSLALEALRLHLGNEIMVNVSEFGVREVAIGQMKVPVDESGCLPVNYYGKGGSFETFSAVDVLMKRVPADSLRGKLVLVGATETGIADIRATPFDPTLPGVEIHATVAANALEGRFLTRDGRAYALEIAFILLAPVLFAFLLSMFPNTIAAAALFVAGAGAYCFLNYHLFSRYSYDLSIIFPLAPLVMTYLGAEAYRNLISERKGRYLKRAFSSYVSPELVEEILKDPDRLKLGGERREVTVLFSDIRGFTSLAESLAPEDLVRLLNSYLSPMTRIVLDEKGTLDKYVGDAIMAIFNAPLDVEGHPARACSTGLRMLARLEDLNAELVRVGLPAIDIGIGIHTGEAVVGNMGADIRFDYTAIGDNVNLASRLEGLNKLYGTHILVSGTTRSLAGDLFLFREVDLVRVKGKEQPVSLFELRREPLPDASAFDAALRLYRAGDFDEAERGFEPLAERDPVSRMYLERCRHYREHPPSGWDGVHVAKEK